MARASGQSPRAWVVVPPRCLGRLAGKRSLRTELHQQLNDIGSAAGRVCASVSSSRQARCSRAFETTWCCIAGRPSRLLPSMCSMPSDDPAHRVSHETIYASIYAHPRGGLKKELVEALRQSKPTRGRHRTTAAKRTWAPEELRIAHRPEEVQQRLVPGHWEGGLIKGGVQPFVRGNTGRPKDRLCDPLQDGRLHGRCCAGRFQPPTEEVPCFHARQHDLRPGHRNDVLCRADGQAGYGCLVRRSPCALATWK